MRLTLNEIFAERSATSAGHGPVVAGAARIFLSVVVVVFSSFVNFSSVVISSSEFSSVRSDDVALGF